MNYYDPIYGLAQVTEPVLLDLLNSAAMLRLKQVLQHGISGLLGVTSPITRFEHSVGVMILVRELGASLTEQIAALLHDVSHTAFSHVIDYVFDGHDSQSYHDEKKEVYMASTTIPAILAQHGYDWRDVLSEENFPLLEQPSPRLCADRLDYFLRDSLALNLAQPADVRHALDHLVVQDGRIAVGSLEAGRWLGYTYIAADDASWANFREVGLYELTAQAIRLGLQMGAIREADFWGSDETLWSQLHACDDAKLNEYLRLISPQTQFVWDEVSPTFLVSTKLRTIDPDVVVEPAMIQPLSMLDADFARHRKEYLARKAGKWPMRVVAHEEGGR
jgi:hypothetical protein